MKALIDNLINGNLRDARRQAKRFSLRKIADAIQEECGYSFHRSVMAAYFLKNQCTWQEYCDTP